MRISAHAAASTILVVLALGFVSTTSAQVDPTRSIPPAADAEARMLFDAGMLAYDGGRYDDALARFQEAYRLSQRPSLLWNIALAADRARQDALALETYQRFLAETPETEAPDQRARAVERVAILTHARDEATAVEARAEQAERDRAAAEEDARLARESEARARADAATSDSPGLTRKWWFWTAIGAVALTAVALPVAIHANRDTTQRFPVTDAGTVILAISGRF